MRWSTFETRFGEEEEEEEEEEEKEEEEDRELGSVVIDLTQDVIDLSDD